MELHNELAKAKSVAKEWTSKGTLPRSHLTFPLDFQRGAYLGKIVGWGKVGTFLSHQVLLFERHLWSMLYSEFPNSWLSSLTSACHLHKWCELQLQGSYFLAKCPQGLWQVHINLGFIIKNYYIYLVFRYAVIWRENSLFLCLMSVIRAVDKNTVIYLGLENPGFSD